MQKPMSRQELSDALGDLGMLSLTLGQTLKVLVVDDDPQAVELIAVRMADLAGTVLRALGGAEAIDMARRELPDAIVLDLLMPDVSGFNVVEELSKDPRTARIPILVMTSKLVTAADRALLGGSGSIIMEKSEFSPDRFSAEVQRALARRKVAP